MTGSSPEAEVVITPAAEATDVSSAVSSPATEGEKSTLDLVNEALARPKEESPPSQQEKAQADAPERERNVDPQKPIDGDLTEEERKLLTPKVQKRFDALTAQRYERDRTIEQLKPKAEQFEAIEQFARASNLSSDDLARSLEISALIKNDPFKALEALTPIVQHLAKATGQELPPEIQEQVNLGYLTREHAQKLVRNERQVEFLEQRRQQQAERERAAEVERSVQERITAGQQAANTWEQRQRASDPDFALKESRLKETLELEVSRRLLVGQPIPTPNEIVDILEKAHKAVSEDLRKFRPAGRTASFVSGGTSARTIAEPASLREAMEAALAGNR